MGGVDIAQHRHKLPPLFALDAASKPQYLLNLVEIVRFSAETAIKPKRAATVAAAIVIGIAAVAVADATKQTSRIKARF